MSKFNVSNEDNSLTSGHTDANLKSLTINALVANFPLKTNASKKIVSELLNIADVNGLPAIISTILVNPLVGDFLTNGNVISNTILDAQQGTTGVITGGIITKSTPTTYSVSAGSGIICYPDSSLNTIVNWGAFTNQTISIGNYNTFIAIDSSGLIATKVNNPFTSDESRNYIVLGDLVHADLSTIDYILHNPYPLRGGNQNLTDLSNSLGIINLRGNVFSANSTNLTLAKTAGSYFSIGSNVVNDINNPNILDNDVFTGGNIYRFKQDGVNTVSTSVDSSNYDLSGVLTAVPSNYWQIQRLFIAGVNTVGLFYGQHVYPNYTAAKTALSSETHIATIDHSYLLRGYLFVKGGATNLSLISDAIFHSSSKFGGEANSAVSGAGDVLGPDLSTTNAIARYSDATGFDIKNSSVLISDAGVISGLTSIQGAIATDQTTFGATDLTSRNYVDGVVTAAGTTIANTGTGGLIYSGITGANVNELKSIKAVNSKLTVTATALELQLSVHENAMNHDSLIGASSTNSHADIDNHIADTTLNYLQTAIDHTNLINKGSNTHTQIDDFITSKGADDGLATLNSNGKVPISQISLSNLQFCGTWNANTNAEAIDTAPATGCYWIVNVYGSYNLGSLGGDWNVGNWAVFDGTDWYRIENIDSINTVAGKTGVVTLEASDLTDVNITTPSNLDILQYDTGTSTFINKTLVGANIAAKNTTDFVALAVAALQLKTTHQSESAGNNTLFSQKVILPLFDSSDFSIRQAMPKYYIDDLTTANTNDITTLQNKTTHQSASVSDTTFSQKILPNVDNTHDLGSSTLTFKDLYINKVTSLLTPTAITDAANKGYVDSSKNFIDITPTNSNIEVDGRLDYSSFYDRKMRYYNGTNWNYLHSYEPIKLTPIMTSNSQAGFVTTASSLYGGFSAHAAYDNNPNEFLDSGSGNAPGFSFYWGWASARFRFDATSGNALVQTAKFGVTTHQEWHQMEMPAIKKITSFKLKGRGDNNHNTSPRDFKVYTSADGGVSWTLLLTVTNHVQTTNTQEIEWNVNGYGSFIGVSITKNNLMSDGWCSLGEIFVKGYTPIKDYVDSLFGKLPHYTVANLPTDATDGDMAFCTNCVPVRQPVYWDSLAGTSGFWRKTTESTQATV